MNEPKELTGRELLKHAAKLLEAVDNKKWIQLWFENKWIECAAPDFIYPLWQYRVKPERNVFYLNVYHGGSVGFNCPNRKEADLNASSNRIACLRVEYEDGQYDD